MRKIVLVSVAASMVLAAPTWAASTPAVVTGSATSITNAGAQLHATVNPGGRTTTYTFHYGLTTSYGSVTGAGKAGSGTKSVLVKTTVSGLNPGTVYHYLIEATNKLGSTFGRDRTFTTTGRPLPGAITGTASFLGTTTATMTGTVITQGETTSFMFQYGPTTNYGLQTASVLASASSTPTFVSQTLTNLSPDTTIHYRLVANHSGFPPQVGFDQTFTTLPLVRFRARVRAHTTPVRARRKPYLFTTIGRIVPPRSLPPGVGCTGFVSVRFHAGRRTPAVQSAPLQPNCTFSTQVLFRHLIRGRKARLRVSVRFGGNSYIRAGSARPQRVRLG